MTIVDPNTFHHRFNLALQRSIVDDEALDEVLNLLARRFACLAAALVYVDEGRPGATIETAHGVVDAVARRRYREDYARNDPAPATMARLNVGEVATTDHLFDINDAKYARFRDEFYYPLGLRGAMGGPVVKAEGRYGILAVQRGADRPAFSKEETADFARLVPLVASALALRRRFFDLETGVATLQNALEEVPVAIMVLHRDGSLRHANRFARTLLERRDGLVLTRTGRLKLSDGAANQRFQALIAALPIAQPSIMQAPRTRSGVPYVLRVMPVSGDIMVKVCDPIGDSVEPEAVLQLGFGMPIASARLTAALLQGKTIADYALIAGLSQNTLKFHLKSAFAATATKRQSDLVRVASAIVREVGALV